MVQTPVFWNSYLRDAWLDVGLEFSAPHYKPALLVSEPGNGAEFLVLALVAGQGCSQPKQGLGCLTCSVCQQVFSRTNSDVMVFDFDEPLKLEAADRIREHLQVSSGRQSEKAVPRTVCLFGMERMNDAGVNRLLKLFEEPPVNTWIIGTATSKDAILDTLQSRLTCIGLPGASQEQIASDYPDLGAFGRSYADGSYGRAQLWHAFDQIELWQDLKALTGAGTTTARFAAAERVQKKIKPAKSRAESSGSLPGWFRQSDLWQALNVQLGHDVAGDSYKRRFMQQKIIDQYKKCTVPYNLRLALDAFAAC